MAVMLILHKSFTISIFRNGEIATFTYCLDLHDHKMKPPVIETKLVPEGHIIAITLFGIVFTRHKDRLAPDMLNHEHIHCRQQLEMLYIPFFILYLAEWLVRYVKYRDSRRAYFNISFEREAYCNDADQSYLSHRKPYAWIQYLRRHG